MRVRLSTSVASLYFAGAAGDVLDLPDTVALSLIKSDQAELVQEPETAMASQPSTAARRDRRRGSREPDGGSML